MKDRMQLKLPQWIGLVTATLLATSISACSDDGKTMGQRLDETTHQIESKAKEAATATRSTLSETGKSIDAAAGKTGEAIDKALSDTGEAIQKTAKDLCTKTKEVVSDEPAKC